MKGCLLSVFISMLLAIPAFAQDLGTTTTINNTITLVSEEETPLDPDEAKKQLGQDGFLGAALLGALLENIANQAMGKASIAIICEGMKDAIQAFFGNVEGWIAKQCTEKGAKGTPAFDKCFKAIQTFWLVDCGGGA